jgi:hypothetical protein
MAVSRLAPVSAVAQTNCQDIPAQPFVSLADCFVLYEMKLSFSHFNVFSASEKYLFH